MYGTWLPGDLRGFVSNVKEPSGPIMRNNIPGTPVECDLPSLQEHARQQMKGDPVRINRPQAEAMLEQFIETAEYRNWQLHSVSVMANHCHLVVGVVGDPEPEFLLQSFKSYASRKLNRRWQRPTGGTWWTRSGSKRKLPDDRAVLAGIRYVVDQEYPLVTWTFPIPELGLIGGRIQ